MREGVDGLGHAVGGHVGEREVAPDLVLALERRGEVERGAVCLDGVHGAPEPHEAAAEVAQGDGGRGVGLVDGGGAVGDAGVADVPQPLVGGAEGHVGLVGRRVGAVLDGLGEGGDGLLVASGGEKRASAVAGERAALAVGGVGEGRLVGQGGGLELPELHVGVAAQVVDLARQLSGGLGLAEVGDGAQPVAALVRALARFVCLLVHGGLPEGDGARRRRARW